MTIFSRKRARLQLASAMVLLSPVLVGCGDAPSDTPSASPSPTGSTSPATPPATPAPTPAPAPASLDLDGLERGDDPGIPYAVDLDAPFLDGDYRVVLPGGDPQGFPLPRESIGEFAVTGEAVVLLRRTEGGVVALVSDLAGTVLEEEMFLASHSVLVSRDRTVAGWLRDDGTVHTLDSDGTHAVDLSGITPGAEAVLVRKADTSPSCQEEVPEGGGCIVYANRPDGGVDYTTSHGISERVTGLRSLADVDDRGRLLGRLSRDPGCWGLLRPTGREVWRTCEHRLDSFSPDARHVLGILGNVRFEEVRGLAVHDRRGTVVTSYDVPRGTSVSGVEWEDDEHLLAVVRRRDRTAIVRVGLDGSVELATDVGPAPSDASGYALEVW